MGLMELTGLMEQWKAVQGLSAALRGDLPATRSTLRSEMDASVSDYCPHPNHRR